MSALLTVLRERTSLDELTLRRIIATAPRRYKVYTIPKRNGGRRWIAQPARELKALQRALVEHFLADCPVHPSATAYVKGSSIRLNAATHAENGPILKLDLRDFFPAITARDWLRYCEAHNLFESREDAVMSSRILFKRTPNSHILRLSIGAPSSPHVSNLMMYDFDRQVAEAAGKEFVTYTRYADDMTFSAKRTGYLNGIEKMVRRVLRSLEYPALYLNDDKKVVATKKYRREVTGLILTNDGRVSLGHKRKRLLRAQLHYFKMGECDLQTAKKLAGTMAFAADVEPEFFARMERVFSVETVQALMATVNLSENGQ